MPLTLYNTLTRRLEEFQSLRKGHVTMYTCGPTVYNYFHIGNARSFVMADILRRYLEYRGYEVRFVMNITDIDDRIIQQSIAEGIDASVVAEKYTAAFFEDLLRFGVRKASLHPRATEHVTEIVAHVARLIEAGAAYELDGDVYFEVNAFPDYGKLSGRKLEDMIAGARVEADLRKRSPADFALWKAAKPGEPSWDSPWGKGRPGWHIECSVMSMKHLGTSFDIHAGGNDLIFPHHENEIAQSEALTHEPLARYWIHFGFLNIDNEKMSKSLGNFFTAREILDAFPASTLRAFYLQTHYRSPLNFIPDALEASGRGVQKVHTLIDQLGADDGGTGPFDLAPYEKRFIEAMDQDFNTPSGLGVLFDLVRDANTSMHSENGLAPDARAGIRDFLERTAGGVFGILPDSAPEATNEEYARLMEFLIAVRARARSDKAWALSDFIRDGLHDLGIQLEDGKSGTTWKRL